MLARSGVLNQLQQFSFDTNGAPLCIYGDLAYPLRIHLQCPFTFRGAQLTPIQTAWNKSMSEVRIAVEWQTPSLKMGFLLVLEVSSPSRPQEAREHSHVKQ